MRAANQSCVWYLAVFADAISPRLRVGGQRYPINICPCLRACQLFEIHPDSQKRILKRLIKNIRIASEFPKGGRKIADDTRSLFFQRAPIFSSISFKKALFTEHRFISLLHNNNRPGKDLCKMKVKKLKQKNRPLSPISPPVFEQGRHRGFRVPSGNQG